MRQRVMRIVSWSAGLFLLAAVIEIVDARLATEEKYPEPRFPSYLKTPRTIEDVMPAARALSRNKSGVQGVGLGVVQKGEAILIVPTLDAEELVMAGIRRALEERGVEVHIQADHEMVGVSRADALALRSALQAHSSEQGYMEASRWIEEQFADPDSVKDWLRKRRPDLYAQLFPASRDLPPHLKAVSEKLQGDATLSGGDAKPVGEGILAYLDKHPHIKGVFWGKAEGTRLRRALYPRQEKFLGLFTTDNRWELMSEISGYPADVWQLVEEKTIEPLAHVDRIHVTDPEGTDVTSELSAVQAERWARGAYQRGHLYMFPNQATGRFGYSVVDYPAFQKEWIPREPIARLDGVVAGTKGRVGFYPRWEVHFKNGYISEVTGGGIYGEALREFLKYPNIQELTFPYHDNPGFWYLYEIAFGTHPKFFRNPSQMETGSLGPERLRSGVIHWGLGIRLWHDPDAPTESKSWMEFTAKHKLPNDHNFHTHTYFTTYRARIRNAERWVTLLDRGRMTSLDDPETRALASRYGNPDRILAEDWIPEVPGINAPGSYQEYARNPWAVEKAVMDQAVGGTYKHYYPRENTSTK